MENFIKVSWETSKTDEPTDMYMAGCHAERADEMVCACAVVVRNAIEALAKSRDKKTATEYVLKMIVGGLSDDAAKAVEGTMLVMPNRVLPDER